MRMHGTFLASHKKAVILSVVGLIVLVGVAGYSFSSFRTWESNDENYKSRKNETASLVNDVLYNTKLSVPDRQAKLSKLGSVQYKDLCEVSDLYKWQRSFIGSLESQHKDCNTQRTYIQSVASRANNMSRYSKDEQKISQHLKALISVKESITASEMTKAIATLQQVEQKIASESLATQQGKELRTLTKDILAATNTSWSALLNASEKQDRAAYDSEIGKLASAYDRFNEVTIQVTNSYQGLIRSLETTSKQSS